MSLAVVHGQFPEWSWMFGFSIFDLHHVPGLEERKRLIQRLAQIFDCDFPQLLRQYEDALPCASHVLRQCAGISNSDAWRETVMEGTRRPMLARLLLRHTTLSGSTTSGVEHVHIKHQWLFTKQRNRLGETSENNELNICCDFCHQEKDAIIEIAQQVWRTLYSGPRKRAKPNKNRGEKRPRKETTLASTEKRQHIAIDVAKAQHTVASSSSLVAVQNKACGMSADVWTEKMTSEIDFNATKRLEDRLQCLDKGLLLADERQPLDIALADGRRTHKHELKRVRLNQAAKKKTAHQMRAPLTWPVGTAVMLTPTAVENHIFPLPRQVCLQSGFHVVFSAIQAAVVVADAPGDLPQKALWELVLSGGTACSHRAFVTKSGASFITFKPAIATGGSRARPRSVWVNKRFAEEHREYYDALRMALRMPISVWRETTRERFCDLTIRDARLPQRQQRPLQQIDIVADSQAVYFLKSHIYVPIRPALRLIGRLGGRKRWVSK